MTAAIVADGVQDALEQDLAVARCELAEARGRQRRKDTPGHRNDVARTLSRIDGLLDMYLEAST